MSHFHPKEYTRVLQEYVGHNEDDYHLETTTEDPIEMITVWVREVLLLHVKATSCIHDILNGLPPNALHIPGIDTNLHRKRFEATFARQKHFVALLHALAEDPALAESLCLHPLTQTWPRLAAALYTIRTSLADITVKTFALPSDQLDRYIAPIAPQLYAP